MALIEDEYVRTITTAELTWVSSVIDDLASGSLTWGAEEFELAQASLGE